MLELRYLVADEIISMLDASTRIDVLNLLGDLKARGLGILFVTHDLSLGNYISDRTVILRRGRVVEQGPTAKVFAAPRHSYTRMLLACVPQLHRKWRICPLVTLGPRPIGELDATGLSPSTAKGDHLAAPRSGGTTREPASGCSSTPCATSAPPTSPARSRGRPSSASTGSSSTTCTAAPAEVRGCSTGTASRRAHATPCSSAIEADPAGLARELEALGTNRLVVAWIPPPRTAREADAVAARLVAAAERVAGSASASASTTTTASCAARRRQPDARPAPDARTRRSSWSSTSAGPGTRASTRSSSSSGPPVACRIVHVKDLRRAGGPMHVALGDGEIDYEALGASAAAAGVEWLVVEQDETDGSTVRGGRSIRSHLLPSWRCLA